MTKTYFKATHSTGAVHLRATNGTGDYKFAVVGPKVAGGASFSSRLDLARAEADRQRGRLPEVEVVPAVEIDRAEYNALLNAGKAKHAVTFRGKKFTKTTSLDSSWKFTHAVGYFRPEQVVRVEIQPSWGAPWHEKYPEGFYMCKDREEFRVDWYISEEQARQALSHQADRGCEVELFTL